MARKQPKLFKTTLVLWTTWDPENLINQGDPGVFAHELADAVEWATAALSNAETTEVTREEIVADPTGGTDVLAFFGMPIPRRTK